MKEIPLNQLRRYALWSQCFWVAILVVSFVVTFMGARSGINELAVAQARFSVDKDMIYRHWAARHGGVYVPVTDTTPPNPNLANIQERDIETPSGKKLTLMNPAYMTRQVFEMGRENFSYKGHITSLNPLRSSNVTDPWEAESLKHIEKAGIHDHYEILKSKGVSELRFMRPLKTEKPCLKCHAIQGYKLGDIRGGISITIPMAPYEDKILIQGLTLGAGHMAIMIFGLFMISAGRRRLETVLEQQYSAEKELEDTRIQLFQQEKLASVGQLAAGVAHEINNPMGFISSNLRTLKKYGGKLDEYIKALQASLSACQSHPDCSEIEELRKKNRTDFIISDIDNLVEESLDGSERVRRIVSDLKNFSRVDQAELSLADINACLDSTINIAMNELKYVADIVRDYGEIPPVECYIQQLNQVFMNLLVNAANAIDGHGTITIRTWVADDKMNISISDTGKGILPEHLPKLFEPFFTTKDVGKGTGLGLSISYDIVKKHGGLISVETEVGKGTTFIVTIPLVLQKKAEG